MEEQNDSRYPYTYAYDYIRQMIGYGKCGMKISRSDAAALLTSLADILHFDKEEATRKIAEAYLNRSPKEKEKSVQEIATWILTRKI